MEQHDHLFRYRVILLTKPHNVAYLRLSASVALAHAGILMYDMVSGCTVSVIDGQV